MLTFKFAKTEDANCRRSLRIIRGIIEFNIWFDDAEIGHDEQRVAFCVSISRFSAADPVILSHFYLWPDTGYLSHVTLLYADIKVGNLASLPSLSPSLATELVFDTALWERPLTRSRGWAMPVVEMKIPTTLNFCGQDLVVTYGGLHSASRALILPTQDKILLNHENQVVGIIFANVREEMEYKQLVQIAFNRDSR